MIGGTHAVLRRHKKAAPGGRRNETSEGRMYGYANDLLISHITVGAGQCSTRRGARNAVRGNFGAKEREAMQRNGGEAF